MAILAAAPPRRLAGASDVQGGGGTGELSRLALGVFAGPSLPISALGLPILVYLPEFFANVLKIPLAVVGTLFLIVRFADLTIDPILGVLMDRTRTPIGRFRPWLLAGAPLAVVFVGLVFLARAPISPLDIGVRLFGLYLAYSVLTLSHAAWASSLSADYHGRSRVYGWLQAGLVLAMIVTPAVAAFASHRDPSQPGAGVRAVGLLVMVLAPATVALAGLLTPERVPAGSARPGQLLELLALVRRAAIARILAADLCFSLSAGTTAALFFFFFREALGYSTAEADVLLLVYFVGALAGAPVLSRLARRIGKHRALLAAAVWGCLVGPFSLLLPRGNMPLGVAFLFVAGLSYSAATIFCRAMLADAADEAEVANGRNATGMLYALLSSTAKIGSALAIFIAYGVLARAGFHPTAGAANGAAALWGLKGCFVLGPILCHLVAMSVLWRYGLTEARHRELRAELDRRRLAV